ncbi:carboxypeptidase-like regulatory domain-containing protein [Ancylomarina sp. 16SWW S1-10-2]|uniref:carboxypeptidase-like regulatory domain-containing protein n=1 Tax=Ancylomarina sp. 16SWW S1-10-2 TaxID=2499681 RepID=UPI0012AD73BE|nr:carboxypeptidase-like regulatory domain-containing protein [Ancylomarina sp. 16SWW S1-10-2]MRT94781.1 carboxypeptidase-like regulatory domain-containing protein [Ancylomarina sp. 16SWW S1-10-2]
MIRILLIILILLVSFNLSKATRIENDSIIRISGQIITKSSTPIPLAHILVKSKRSGQICDSLGIFHLQINQSDTLIISALGFKTQEWPIPLIFDTSLPLIYQITLEKMAYLLQEVNVFAFGTWDDFKADFLKLEIKDDYLINTQLIKELAPYNTRPPNIIPPQYRATIEEPSIWDAIGSPASFLFTKFNSKEKSKRKVSKLIRNEWRLKKLAKYYTSEIVSAHTGLKGEALEAFMAYCGPKLEITKTNSQYDIAEQIVKNYKRYLEQNKIK